MKQRNKNNPSFALWKAFAAGCMAAAGGLLLGGCTATDEWPANQDYAVLSPKVLLGGATTRSVISGVDANPGGYQIKEIQLFVVKNDDGYTPYPYAGAAEAGNLSTFTLTAGNGSSDEWIGNPEVKLSADMARIFAFYPPITKADFTPSQTDLTHKIKVTIPAVQTFDVQTTWGCSQTDYLYGSKESTVGDVTPITANNAKGDAGSSAPFSPTISMQHALALLEFRLQSKSGRDVDNTYDYVKEIRLATSGDNQFRVAESATPGTMQIADGTLDLANSPTLTFRPKSGSVKCGTYGSPVLVAYGLVAPLTAELSDLKVTVVLDKQNDTTTERRELSVKIAPKTWQKGNRYQFTLTLSDRNIEINKVDVSPWQDQDINGNDPIYPDGLEPTN